jgi:hypothetical protein
MAPQAIVTSVFLQEQLKTAWVRGRHLFRFHRFVAARRAGRGDDRHRVARWGRTLLHSGVDIGRRGNAPPERLSWELVDPLAGGTAGALGCFAPCSSAVAPKLAKASNAAARNHMLRIAASTLVLL